MKHKVRVIVRKNNGEQEILGIGHKRLSGRLLRILFGDFCEALVLVPGKTVSGIEIVERKDGEADE